MKKFALFALCMAALCACTKTETADLQTEEPATKAAKEYLDITIRIACYGERGGGTSTVVQPLPGDFRIIDLEGWIYFGQAWAKATVPGRVDAPDIDRISFTLKDVYSVNEYGSTGMLGDFEVFVDFPRPGGSYSEQMPFIASQNTYIDKNSLKITPTSLANDYIIRWNCETFPILTPSVPNPNPDPDPEPDPDPFDSLLRSTVRL